MLLLLLCAYYFPMPCGAAVNTFPFVSTSTATLHVDDERVRKHLRNIILGHSTCACGNRRANTYNIRRLM